MNSTVLPILESTTVAQDPRATALRRTHLGSHAHYLSRIMIFSQPCPSSPVDWCPQSSSQTQAHEDSSTEIRPKSAVVYAISDQDRDMGEGKKRTKHTFLDPRHKFTAHCLLHEPSSEFGKDPAHS